MNSLQQYTRELAYAIVPQPLERAAIENFFATVVEALMNHFRFNIERCIPIGEFARETVLRHTIDKKTSIQLMILFQNDEYYENFSLMKQEMEQCISSSFSLSDDEMKQLRIPMKFGAIQLVPSIVVDSDLGSNLFISSLKHDKWIQSNPLEFDEKINNKNNETSFLLKPIIRLLKYWNSTHGRYFSTETIELFAANRISNSDSLHTELLRILEQLPVLLKENVQSIRVLQEVQELTIELKQLLQKKHDEFQTLFIFKQIFPPILQ